MPSIQVGTSRCNLELAGKFLVFFKCLFTRTNTFFSPLEMYHLQQQMYEDDFSGLGLLDLRKAIWGVLHWEWEEAF